MLGWIKPEIYLNQSDFVVVVCLGFGVFGWFLFVFVLLGRWLCFGWVRVKKTNWQTGLPSHAR